ncbi:hypothetical protein [Streptomyces sp. NPDC055749]
MNDDRDVSADVAAIAATAGGYYYAPDITADENDLIGGGAPPVPSGPEAEAR